MDGGYQVPYALVIIERMFEVPESDGVYWLEQRRDGQWAEHYPVCRYGHDLNHHGGRPGWGGHGFRTVECTRCETEGREDAMAYLSYDETRNVPR